MTVARIAASLPVEQFEALERARQQLRLKRSEVIQQALAQWLEARESDAARARYVAGYQSCPESAGGEGLTTAWATGLESEEW